MKKLAGGLVQVSVVGGDEQLYRKSSLARIAESASHKLEPAFRFHSTACTGRARNATVSAAANDFDPAKVITGLVEASARWRTRSRFASQGLIHSLQVVAAAHGIDLNTPFENSPRKSGPAVEWRVGPRQDGLPWNLRILEAESGRVTSEGYRDWLMRSHVGDGMSRVPRKRLRPESLAVKVNAMSIADFTPANFAPLEVARSIKLAGREEKIAGRVNA